MSPQFFHQMEAGKRGPSLETLDALCRVFRVKLESLVALVIRSAA